MFTLPAAETLFKRRVYSFVVTRGTAFSGTIGCTSSSFISTGTFLHLYPWLSGAGVWPVEPGLFRGTWQIVTYFELVEIIVYILSGQYTN